MTDYLGNEIKEGVVIKIIRTKPIFCDVSIIKFKKNGKGYFKKKVVKKAPKKCWEQVGDECLVTKDDDGTMRYIIDGGDCGTISMLLDEIMWFNDPNKLLTIKGISDMPPKNKSYETKISKL